MIVLLDTGPLGIVTNPKMSPEALACATWLQGLLANGVRVYIPDIADYELRRELLRADKRAGIERLDQLRTVLPCDTISTDTLMLAASMWAMLRLQGLPTAEDKALDGDVILMAHAALLQQQEGDLVTIATTNVGHISRMWTAKLWREISP